MLSLKHLSELADRHRDCMDLTVQEFEVRGRRFDFNQRPRIMGVINLSPDSWYRESVVLGEEAALRRARVLAAQGADLVDVGAESTLEHAARVDAAGQNSRLIPLVRGLASEGILTSVETYQVAVARECLESGAAVLNLTGTDPTEEMLRLVARHHAAVILCFVRGEHVRAVNDLPESEDPIDPLYEFFGRQIERAQRAGVSRIFIDPGLGFYYRNLQDGPARVRRQMEIFLNSFRLRRLGWPVCHALPHAFEWFGEEVRCAEPFFSVLAALGRTDLFRTHEVPRVRAVLETLQLY